MRVFDGFQFGQEGPDYGAEYGGAQWTAEQAAVAPVTSTDWLKTVATAVTSVAKPAAEVAKAVMDAKAKAASAKAAAAARVAAARMAVPTGTPRPAAGGSTSPLVYVGVIGGGVVVLGLLAYVLLS